MRKGQYAFDLNRVAAVEFVDAALGADRRQLIKQYIENVESSPKLADRIWQALWEMSQAFTLAYQAALEAALTQVMNARWKSALPLLFVRLVHFHGTDAKLRVFKYERWIPAKWMELHQIYLRSCELGCDRQAMALPAAGAGVQLWSVEQEYLYVLLVHQLNTGQPRSGRGRLGQLAAARVEPPPRVGADTQIGGGLFRRSRGPLGARSARRQ